MKAFIIFPFATVLLFLSSWTGAKDSDHTDSNSQEIRIGNQIWMDSNLDVDTFQNGDKIPEARTKKEWARAANRKKPAWCYYENDIVKGQIYGKLYNWYAVKDPRGLAPKGWRIPQSADWSELLNFLGGNSIQTVSKLKSTDRWNNDGSGLNSSGFNALPAGSRSIEIINQNDGFSGLGGIGIWWSNNKPKRWAEISCLVIRSTGKAEMEWQDTWDGLSVRCIRDR
jgi:uncharacterized protein (TIGR02145 family)